MLDNLYSAVDRELEINEVTFEFSSLLLFRKLNSKFIYYFFFLRRKERRNNKILEVWRFGKPTKLEIENGEICGMDAQAQGGSGEIRKAPTT